MVGHLRSMSTYHAQTTPTTYCAPKTSKGKLVQKAYYAGVSMDLDMLNLFSLVIYNKGK